MSTIPNSNAKPDSVKAPEPKAVPAHVDFVSERAMRTNWMPFWRPVDEGIDPSKPPCF